MEVERPQIVKDNDCELEDRIFFPGTGEGPTLRLPRCHVGRKDQEEIHLGHGEAEHCPSRYHGVAPVPGPHSLLAVEALPSG